MRRARMYVAALGCLAVLGLASASVAEEVTVAAASGRVDFLPDQAEEWTPLGAGRPLAPLDQLRTGTSSWVRLHFPHGTVVVVGPESWVRLDEATFEEGRTRVLVRLLGGRLRALAGSDFPAAGRFEVETPTAVVSVHGTHFIVIYDAEQVDTRVIAIDGRVKVLGVLGVLGRPVILVPGTMTVVRKGAFPVAAMPSETMTVAALMRELDLSVSPSDTLLAGFTGGKTRAVAEAPSSVAEWPEEAGRVAAVERPGWLLRWRRLPVSQHGAVIDQPIAEYASTPPGQTPPGSVTVVILDR